MAINFNHTIVWARDSQTSATFLADVLGLPAPRRWGPFLVVTTDNGTNIDFMDADSDIAPQHYAFLVSETEFDEIFGRVRERSLPY
jgi:catechol 2,3-dioxygenase-like lactoylglutathione lyase family enzyme